MSGCALGFLGLAVLFWIYVLVKAKSEVLLWVTIALPFLITVIMVVVTICKEKEAPAFIRLKPKPNHPMDSAEVITFESVKQQFKTGTFIAIAAMVFLIFGGIGLSGYFYGSSDSKLFDLLIAALGSMISGPTVIFALAARISAINDYIRWGNYGHR